CFIILIHIIPRDRAQIMACESAHKEQVENIRERLGLNDPYPVQYWNYISNAVQGDLGSSIRSGRSVSSEIGGRLMVTIELAFYSTILSVFFGFISGIVSVTKQYYFQDVSLMILYLILLYLT